MKNNFISVPGTHKLAAFHQIEIATQRPKSSKAHYIIATIVLIDLPRFQVPATIETIEKCRELSDSVKVRAQRVETKDGNYESLRCLPRAVNAQRCPS